MTRINLDHAATTPTDPRVVEAMLPYFDGAYGNPSSLHTSGRLAHAVLQSARETVAAILGAKTHEIVFTGSGTESDNLAVQGVARARRGRGKHILLSTVEHKAVMESGERLRDEGFGVTRIPVDQHGLVSVPKLLSLVRDDTTLVSLMLVNNELGTIEPVSETARALRERFGNDHRPFLHTDACQAAGYLDIGVGALGVDLMTLNGSKIGGPKGVGVLYVREGVLLAPLLVGGGQERGLRAGTESLPLIVGMAEALRIAVEEREHEARRLNELRAFFVEALQRQIGEIRVNGHPEHHAPHIVHVTVPDIEGESMLLMLDEEGIDVATGSACGGKELKPSHVLIAIGQSDAELHGSLRFSFGRDTTKEALHTVIETLSRVVSRLQSLSVMRTNLYHTTYAKR